VIQAVFGWNRDRRQDIPTGFLAGFWHPRII
jgi:hypothetical protein